MRRFHFLCVILVALGGSAVAQQPAELPQKGSGPGKPLDAKDAQKLFKLDDWNDVVIAAKGSHIQHYLNNRLILDFTDNHPELALKEGILALQLHAGKPMWTEFKNIRIREIK